MENLILRQSKKGKAVFANKNFKKGEKLIGFKGKLFTYSQLPAPYSKADDHYVQIGKNLYMGPSGKLDDFINHSCNPNSGLKIQSKIVNLVAIKSIKKGEEVTWDYSITMDEDDWEMVCKCGSKNCRKRVKDFKYLPKRIQKKYIKLGVVTKYILRGLKEKW